MKAIPVVPLLIESSRGHGRGLLRGVARFLETHGPWSTEPEVPFYVTEGSRVNPIRKLRAGGFDGIISRDWEGADSILALNLPAVFVYGHQPPPDTPAVAAVVANDAGIGKMAAEYFMRLGFHNFAYLGFDHLYWSEGRRESFSACLGREGFPVALFEQHTSKRCRRWDYEEPRVAKWLRSLPKPCALFACNDDRALQAAAACRLADLHIPNQVAILGVDDDEFLCQFWHPPISSIRLALEKAGYEAAGLLEHLMTTKQSKGGRICIEPLQVTTRVSTETLSVGDSKVAVAVSYIRANARQRIDVDEVARAAGVSRRGLYELFNQQLGHTIHEEITAVRLAEIERLLIETSLSISQIAYRVGFSTPEYLSRFFRHHRQMTPSQFRRHHLPR